MNIIAPEKLLFQDDGTIPNSKYPVLLYRNVFQKEGDEGAKWLMERFENNDWSNAWKNGIYPFHHYHSTAHEVLGIYEGWGIVMLGGENGKTVEVSLGDILVLPAGVGHKCVHHLNLKVVGAYADGREWDINKGEANERPQADVNIGTLPLPKKDPFHGNQGLPDIWQ